MFPSILFDQRDGDEEIRIRRILGQKKQLLIVEQDPCLIQAVSNDHLRFGADLETQFHCILQALRVFVIALIIAYVPVNNIGILLLQKRNNEVAVRRVDFKEIRRNTRIIPNPVKKYLD
jgi:hypothetical protein